MKRGPLPGTARNIDERSFLEKAQSGWDGDLPDWVSVLASHADAHSLKVTGDAIGYSHSLVSNVIAGKYRGDLGRVKERVRGALMGLTVECPGTGEPMPRHTCLDWQKKPFEATSQQRCRMYRACRGGCPNFLPKGKSDER